MQKVTVFVSFLMAADKREPGLTDRLTYHTDCTKLTNDNESGLKGEQQNKTKLFFSEPEIIPALFSYIDVKSDIREEWSCQKPMSW